MTDQDQPYFIYKNSWGFGPGLNGYFWAAMEPMASPKFTDRNHTGQCGITSDVGVWELDAAPTPTAQLATSG